MKVSTRRTPQHFTVAVTPSLSELLLAVGLFLPAIFIHRYKAETLMWSIASFAVFAFLSLTSIPGSSHVTLHIPTSKLLIERTKYWVSVVKIESEANLIEGIKLESGRGEVDGVKIGKKVAWRLLLGSMDGYAIPFFEGWLAGDAQREQLEQAGRDMARLMDVGFSLGEAQQ